MSLVHRLIVGHFDIDTFVSRRPVPLRPLDTSRTRGMLREVGFPVSEGEYVVDGERLYFVDGYCDCPWLSNKHNRKSEWFARAVARLEDCSLIETGVGTILHPESLQAVPHAFPCRGGSRLAPLTQSEAEACARDGAPGVLCRTVLEAAEGEGDWVEGFCAGLAEHADFHVRGNALFALGRMASKKSTLDRALIQPIIERAMADPVPYVSGQAMIAAETVEQRLTWVISAFDNGEPELDVATYSNGWIRCPNCGWRYASYDQRAFREGRCMECRQRLRVVDHVT